jgi:hypothetical protein
VLEIDACGANLLGVLCGAAAIYDVATVIGRGRRGDER